MRLVFAFARQCISPPPSPRPLAVFVVWQVRRKLAGSLAGTSAAGSDGLSDTGAGAADATVTRKTPGDTSDSGEAGGGGGGGEDAAGAAAVGVDPSPADMAAAIAEVSNTELAALRAEEARRMQQKNLLAGLASFAGGREGDGDGEEEEEELGLDRPLLLAGAMETLGAALVVLPEGDTRAAMQCVG